MQGEINKAFETSTALRIDECNVYNLPASLTRQIKQVNRGLLDEEIEEEGKRVMAEAHLLISGEQKTPLDRVSVEFYKTFNIF